MARRRGRSTSSQCEEPFEATWQSIFRPGLPCRRRSRVMGLLRLRGSAAAGTTTLPGSSFRPFPARFTGRNCSPVPIRRGSRWRRRRRRCDPRGYRPFRGSAANRPPRLPQTGVEPFIARTAGRCSAATCRYRSTAAGPCTSWACGPASAPAPEGAEIVGEPHQPLALLLAGDFERASTCPRGPRNGGAVQ